MMWSCDSGSISEAKPEFEWILFCGFERMMRCERRNDSAKLR
jgi:hypothetical protein